jgi:hypothetical protein
MATTESGEVVPLIPPAQQLELARVAIELASAEYLAHVLESGENPELLMSQLESLMKLIDVALKDYLEDGQLGSGEGIIGSAEVAHEFYLAHVGRQSELSEAQRASRIRRADGLLNLLRAVFWEPTEPRAPIVTPAPATSTVGGAHDVLEQPRPSPRGAGGQ